MIDSLYFDAWAEIRWGRYYAPDGTLGSEVKDGTGIATHWSPEGIITFQLEMRDYERYHLKTWNLDGSLNSVADYDENGREIYRDIGTAGEPSSARHETD